MIRRLTIVLALVVLAGGCGGGSGNAASAPDWEVAHTSAAWWMCVYAPAADDQWIVGGTTTDGQVMRFDGTTTTAVDHGADVGLLNWIHGFGDDRMIVVGNQGAVLRTNDGGTTWTADDPATDQDLWGVWGSSPNDVWAVGGDAMGGVPTILHDTGTGFRPVAIPDLERPGVNVFFKVWGSGPDDVYVVGQNGAVLHWGGSGFEELLVGVSQDLIGVWGDGPDRVVAVGGRTNGAAAIWDGTSWTNPDLGRYPGLSGVWVGDGIAYVVGDNGAAGTIDLSSGVANVTLVDTPVTIHSVAGTATTLTAVGGDFTTGPQGPFLGQVLTAQR